LLENNYYRVLQFINNNPGAYFRKIKKELNLSIGTTQYQLNKLEKDGKIVSIRKHFYKFYFPNGIFKDNEKELLQILSHRSLRQILLYIIEKKDPTKNEIVNDLKISYSSMNWHLTKLVSSNMIIENKNNAKYTKYSINHHYISVSDIIKILQQHYSYIWNNWANRLAEIFLVLSTENGK